MAVLVPFNKRRAELSPTSIDFFNNMLDDFFTDGWPARRSLFCDTFKIDVSEDDKNYIIEAELPGVKKDEIGITIDDGKLNISVTRDEKVEEDKKNYLHRERRYCSMQRSIYLADADSAGIHAKLDNGELTVTVPKKKNDDTSLKINIE
jgi:HSP20 family protein